MQLSHNRRHTLFADYYFAGAKHNNAYKKRDGFFSFNVQTVTDPKCKIRDVTTSWPGSVQPKLVFDESDLKIWLERGIYGNRLLIGSRDYENKPYLVTALSDPKAPEERFYNDCLEKARAIVEKQHKMWKNRFRMIRHPYSVKLSLLKKVLVATAVMHNLAIDEEDPMPEDDTEDCEDTSSCQNQSTENVVEEENPTRTRIIREYFKPILKCNTDSKLEVNVFCNYEG